MMDIKKLKRIQKVGLVTEIKAKSHNKAVLSFVVVPATDEELDTINPDRELAMFVSQICGVKEKLEFNLLKGIYPQEVVTLEQKLEYARKMLVGEKLIFTKYSFSIEDYFADIKGQTKGLRQIYDSNNNPIHSLSIWYCGAYADDLQALLDLERKLKNRLESGYYMLYGPTDNYPIL